MGAYTLRPVNRQPTGTWCTTQGTHLGLCDNPEGWGWAGGERDSRGRGHMDTYGQFMLMYDRN